MRCEEVNSFIKSYYNGSLEEYTRIKIHHHLVGCKTCSEEYDMWLLGEEYIREMPSVYPTVSDTPNSSVVMKNVMGRIQHEERWANPSVEKKIPFVNRLKLFATFIVSMLFITAILFFVTTLTPEIEAVDDHVISLDMMGDSWKIDEVVMHEREELGETSMDFQVVASLNHPIIYTLAEENKDPPYTIIFSAFFVLMFILGLSWMTRT